MAIIALKCVLCHFIFLYLFKTNWRRQTHYLYVGLLFKAEPPHLLTLTVQHSWIRLETMALMWLMQRKDGYILVIYSRDVKYNIKHSYSITVNNFQKSGMFHFNPRHLKMKVLEKSQRRQTLHRLNAEAAVHVSVFRLWTDISRIPLCVRERYKSCCYVYRGIWHKKEVCHCER